MHKLTYYILLRWLNINGYHAWLRTAQIHFEDKEKKMEKKQNNIYPEYSANGDGKAIIEILNIGFEPLLT